MSKARFSADDVAAGRMFWLLDLTWAGRVRRFSTDTLLVSSDDGALPYDGTLDLGTVREEITLWALSLGAMAIPVRVLHLEGVASLVAAGHGLDGATAEISQWIEGSAWEDRRVVMRGRLRNPVYGETWINATVEQEVWADQGRVPTTTARVDATTWDIAYLGEGDHPLDYPVVFGSPGNDSATIYGYFAGSPGVWGDKQTSHHYLILAGHHVEATQVWLVHDDDSVGNRFVVTNGYDDRGAPVAYVGNPGVTVATTDNAAWGAGYQYWDGLDNGGLTPAVYAPAVADISQLWVCWRDETATSKCAAMGSTGSAIRGAGDLLEWLIGSFSSIPLDAGRSAATRDVINGFRLSGFIDEGCTPWEWIAANVLPLLPLSFVRGPNGIYPVAWRADAVVNDAVAHISEDDGPVFEFADRITSSTDKILNDFTLDYGWSPRTDRYAHTTRLGATYAESASKAAGILAHTTGAGVVTLAIRSKATGPAGIVHVEITDSGAETLIDLPGRVIITIDGVLGGSTTTTITLATLVNTSTQIECTVPSSGSGFTVIDTKKADFYLQLPDDGTKPSPTCAASQLRYTNDDGTGVFPEALQTKFIYDRATAEAVLEWRSRAFGFATRRIEGQGSFSSWGWIERGDVVTLTCARMALSAQVAIVEAVECGDDGMAAFSFVVVENAGRDRV